MTKVKFCSACKQYKNISDFGKDARTLDGLKCYCKECKNLYERNRTYKNKIYKPMSENKECAFYLGVHIAERILSNVFKNVEQMVPNNPGYDFICNNGYKIDVKSSCKIKSKLCTWTFSIKKNTIPDYFLCIAFDNREDLNPLHLWLIPSNVLNTKTGVSISSSTLCKWKKYEKDIDTVTNYCNALR